MSLTKYIETQRANLESALRFELFGTTIPRMDKLYRISIEAAPALPKDKPPAIEKSLQSLLICHKSFLAAATLIGQAQPDDAAPITRRAIEAIKLASAMKADPAIEGEWVAYEKRMQRWEARQKGEKPKRLDVPIPVSHPLVEQLMDSYGIFSDADVHFTPEYLCGLAWEEVGKSKLLSYFNGEHIESDILHLLGAHMMMLQVLDDCLDSALSDSPEWQKLRDEIHAAARPYAKRFGDHTGVSDPKTYP